MALNGNIVRQTNLSGTIVRPSGGGTVDQLFFATYGTTTNAEIEAAFQAGKVCVCIRNGFTHYLVERSDANAHVFACVDGAYMRDVYVSDNTWGNDSYILSIPEAGTATPKALGTAAVGTSTKYAREDHVHAKPTIPTAASSGTPAMDGTASRGSSANFARADHVHPTDTSRAADTDLAAKADKVTEVTVSTAGAVTQALDPEKIYHFTGALTALTITLNAPASGQIAEYHFDFLSGSTAPTLTMPNTVTMPDSFAVEASKRYEVNVLNNYGAVVSWAVS